MSLDISLTAIKKVSVFDSNMTHNVTPMWAKAGVYDCLYNSEGLEAQEILPTLANGYTDMVMNKEDYEKLNPENGWGSYEVALKFLEEVIDACKEHPDSIIQISK